VSHAPQNFFQLIFLPDENAGAPKTKAAEALGFRGSSSPLSHLWGHSLGNVWVFDFKGGKKLFSKKNSFASFSLRKKSKNFFGARFFPR
jgi:hypothetical protein